uniref:CopG antitoxin of type II toxin-antitoxin system n=1 Tax=Candidatus Kentrum sp. FM TaxID=2126340 RepID=A0A450RZH7_9GAMM|nr:MAG: CopG antitoxin of type II toxin-antitoxin system [Candidatus Kentron sp. FM]VFJ52571.1 MAG: CopG antitoxin of type II toxin-antitoxin system [Candidatus Kentron sp. FM]VFK09533.1 MAG: CopG antitoxin of type II toxin-antitoxin system [Candidatus Kentron sp. FM]
MNCDKIPKIDSISELATFWDTHDLTDFEDELEEVPGRVFAGEIVIAPHLSPMEAETVSQLASSQGMRPTNLIHKWIAEKTALNA